MPELDREANAGMPAHLVDDVLERRFGFVVPQSQVARGNAAIRFDCRGFDAKQSRPRHGQSAQVNQMPRGGFAVVRDVLAHRRDNDPVRKPEAAKLDRGKQNAHFRPASVKSDANAAIGCR